MRLLFVLFDLMIPLLILLCLYFGYKSLTKKSDYNKWEKTAPKNSHNRHTLPFSHFMPDWNVFMDLWGNAVPKSAYASLKSIKHDLENLERKSQIEDFDKNKPQQQYLMADIVYKHAPDLVKEFVQLPQSLLDVKNSKGQSPTDLINSNMAILANSFKELSLSLFENNLHKMKVQQAHFQTKFGDNTKEFEG